MSRTTKNNVCIVTGGANGIGAAISLRLAELGYAVTINYLNDHVSANNIANAISLQGGESLALQADLRDHEQIEFLFRKTNEKFGKITALVNNAASIPTRHQICELEVEAIQEQINIGLIAPIICIRSAVNYMKKNMGPSKGAIVNISSQASITGGTNLTAYVAAKSGMNAVTYGLAKELGPLGIRINSVLPGLIETRQIPISDKNWLNKSIEFIPLQRLGFPSEVAKTVSWLLSDDASYVTGILLPVTGGR